MIKIKILILFLFLSINLFSQNSINENKYLYRYYNNTQSIHLVHSITQDSNGYIWISSENGIFRFDGNLLTPINQLITSNIKLNSITKNSILQTDTLGNIWFFNIKDIYNKNLPNNKNLGCINIYNGEFTDHTPNLLKEDFSIFSFSIDGDNIWLGTSIGLINYNPTNNQCSLKIKINNISAISKKYNNIIWVSTPDKIIKYNTTNESYQTIESKSKFFGTPKSITQLNNTSLLIGNSQNGGLWLYNIEQNTFKNIINNTTINCIEPFFDNKFCMATKNGIYIYNPQDNNIELIRKGSIKNLSIPESFISTIFKDKEGGLWIGSYYQGFCYMPKQPIELSFNIPEKTNKNFKGNVVMSLCEDKYNNIWVATQDDGINKYNPKTKEFTNFSRNNPKNKIESSNFFQTIAIDNQLWLGSIDMGIEVIDILSGRSIKKYVKDEKKGSIISNVIIVFYYSKDGELYIGTTDGLMKYNKNDDTFTHLFPNDIKATNSIYKDGDNLWVGTWDGLYKIDKNNNLKSYFYNQKDSSSISMSAITSIFKSKLGYLYIGTYNGLNIYNYNTDNFTHFLLDKINPIAINGIVEDKDGIIWGTSDNGIFRYNQLEKSLVQYNNLDGDFIQKLNQMPFIASNNIIYFGMHNGFVSFNPDKFTPSKNNYKPKLQISKIVIKNNNNSIDTTIWNNNTLKLKYNQNNISIYYSYPTYIYSNNFTLSYQLEGLNDKWIYTTKYSPIDFQNLPDGKYKLHINIKDLSGTYKEDTTTFAFEIKPPFWKTVYAYIIYLVLMSIILHLIFRFITKKQLKKATELKAKIEKEKELEMYNTKIHFFMTIAHEIRTPLTLINIPLEDLIEKYKDNEQTSKQLSLIEKNSKRLSELSSQLLNFKKIDSQDNTLKYTKIDVVSFINEMLYMFSSSIKNREIEIIKHLPETPIEAYLDKELFTKITSNLINNAIKYSNKYFEIRLTQKNKDLHFSFINDGYIIPEEDKENVFTLFYRSPASQHKKGNGIGLSISLQLSHLLGGSLELLFDISGKNHFELILPQNNTDIKVEDTEFSDNAEETTKEINDDKLKTILIVEDNKDLRDHIANSFKNEYNVISAYNCSEALTILKNNTISIVVSDIITPGGIDGLQLCRIIKSTINLSHIPVILMSANGNEDTKLTGIEYGADVYLEKPFSIKQLSAQVKNLLKGREQIYDNLIKKPINPFTAVGKNKIDELFFNNFYKLVEKNLSDPNLNMQFLANKLNISQSSMYKKVKDITDVSPNDFIRIARLKKGATLISEGEMSIKEITYQVGYSSPTYFTVCFQRQFGATPTEYAKSLKESSIKQVEKTKDEIADI